jgi:hypothetical protein
MKLSKFIALSAIGFSLIASQTGGVYAITRSPQEKVRPSTIVTDKAQKCEIVKHRLSQKVKYLTTLEDKHVGNYKRAIERIKKLEEVFISQGMDISALSAARSKLEDMVKDLEAQYKELVSTVEEAEEAACSTDKEELKALLKDARTQLGQIKQLQENIRTYFANTVKPEVKKLRGNFKTLTLTPTAIPTQ